jgi:hypothetical protein
VRMQWLEKGIPSAGLYAGAAAWAVNTQLGYSLVPWACAHDARIILPILAFTFAAFSTMGGILSWRALAPARPSASSLLARIGVLSAALFALAIALQGSAALALTGCER